MAILSGVAVVALCSAPFSCSVEAATNTVTLTTAQTVALFGNTIECEYLSTDGTYKTITGTYASNITISEGNYYSPYGQDFTGRQAIQYSLPYRSDMNVTPADITIFFKTSVDLSGVGYVDTAVLQLSAMQFDYQIYGSYTDYWYTSEGYFYPLTRSEAGAGADLYGNLWQDASYQYSILPAFLNTADTQDFSFGWARCGNFANRTYSDAYYIGIVCPILSEDYIYTGNNGAGSGSGSSGDSSNTDSSGSGTDLSAVLSKLDTIISLLSGNNNNQNQNQINSRLENIESAINPSYNQSQYNDMDIAASYYYENERRLVGDSYFNVNAVNSYDFNMPDYSSYGEPVDLISGFFDSNKMVMLPMFGIVFALGIVSYILFGKVG